MPDVNGQMYAADHVAELQSRGFDGFPPGDLLSFVNRGYRHIARRSRWMWEKTDATFTMNPGTSYIDLTSATIPTFRSLDKLIVTTAGQRRKLEPLRPDQFFERWLPLDLTATVNQGEPSGYYIYRNRLYILSPPNAQRTFQAFYTLRLVALTAAADGTGLPVTPIHLDEAIQLAALIRAHKRANEPTLAAIAESDLEEFFDDMRDDEDELMEEVQERVTPDRGWL